jgi:hypothetical protein
MIVPKHNFVGWISRIITTPYDCEDITSEKHFDDADSTIEFSFELITVGARVVDSKSCLGAS